MQMIQIYVDVVEPAMETVKTMFKTSAFYLARKSLFDGIESASGSLEVIDDPANADIVHLKLAKRARPTSKKNFPLYQAWHTLHHPNLQLLKKGLEVCKTSCSKDTIVGEWEAIFTTVEIRKEAENLRAATTLILNHT